MDAEHRPMCVVCRRAFEPLRTGVPIDVRAYAGARPMYKTHADHFQCPGCGVQIYAGFGAQVDVSSSTYDLIKAEVVIHV